MKKVAILQSNYIPWKGYFDMIAAVDEFIIYDEMQYTKNDWRNRNKIKTPQGVLWLTVPVKIKGRFGQSILDTEINGEEWKDKHWKALTMNYRKSSMFSDIANLIEPIYQGSYKNISELNVELIKKVCSYLAISTKITSSRDYRLDDGKTERLVSLCMQAGASEYISGPAAKDYIQAELFDEANIKLTWFDYQGYPEYPQLWGEFTHEVSILDLLFNCGKDSANYMRYVK